MQQKKTNSRRRDIPLSEWIAAAIGVAVVLASVAILVYGAATSHDSPPRLSVRVGSIEKAGAQYLVIVEVFNEGGSTAADARIEAELRPNGVMVERGETTIDFVPPKSKRRAGVFFNREPAGANQLTVRASSYREP
jgi:uncharacterized protein (TIGR02588 family)